jgi:hypothetical protein
VCIVGTDACAHRRSPGEPGSVERVSYLAAQSVYFTEQSVIAALVLTRVPALGL